MINSKMQTAIINPQICSRGIKESGGEISRGRICSNSPAGGWSELVRGREMSVGWVARGVKEGLPLFPVGGVRVTPRVGWVGGGGCLKTRVCTREVVYYRSSSL